MKPIRSDQLVLAALEASPMTVGELVASLKGQVSERSIRYARARLADRLTVSGTGHAAVLSLKPATKPATVAESATKAAMGGERGGPNDRPKAVTKRGVAAAAAAVEKPATEAPAVAESAITRARIEALEAQRDYWRDRNRREQEAHDERGRVSRDEHVEAGPVDPPTHEEEVCIKERLEQLKDEGKRVRNEPYMRRLILKDVRRDEATKAALKNQAEARARKRQAEAMREPPRPALMKPPAWQGLVKAGAT